MKTANKKQRIKMLINWVNEKIHPMECWKFRKKGMHCPTCRNKKVDQTKFEEQYGEIVIEEDLKDQEEEENGKEEDRL